MVVLDTNILIDHLRQPKGEITLLIKVAEKYSGESLAVSTISIQELYEGKSTREKIKEIELIDIVSSLIILPYNFEVAKMAGEISRDLKRPIEFADAAIAATAIINGCQLYTLDKKDFLEIPGLELFK